MRAGLWMVGVRKLLPQPDESCMDHSRCLCDLCWYDPVTLSETVSGDGGCFRCSGSDTSCHVQQ
jgi:hypothetical protein